MALQFLPEGGVVLSIHAVKIKNVLGDINADTDNVHGLPLICEWLVDASIVAL